MVDALPVPAIICETPRIVDGDTLRCGNISARIRLLGIDAPELPGHCRAGRTCVAGDSAASLRQLERIASRGSGQVYPAGFDRYGRMLARVTFAGQDASCAMLAAGAAERRYTWVDCAD